MSEKIDAIKDHILEEMPRRSIEYLNENGFHKFRIEGDGPTHWLCMGEEIVDDSESDVLINFINIYRVVETFNQSENSKWLYLSGNGFREVDKHFTK